MLRDSDISLEFNGVPIEPYRGPLASNTGKQVNLTSTPSASSSQYPSAASNIVAVYGQALAEGERIERWAGWGAAFPAIAWSLPICTLMISPYLLIVYIWVSPIFALLIGAGLFNTFRSIKNIRHVTHRGSVIAFALLGIALDVPLILILGSLLVYWLQTLFARLTLAFLPLLSVLALDSFPTLC